MLRKKLGSFDDWINTYFQSFVYLLRYKHFLVSIFCKVSWCCCTEFNQSWKTSWRHKNIQWLIDLSVANIIFAYICESRYFECLISRKQSITNKQKRAVSAASTLVDHMLVELYLQNWVPGLQVLHSFLSNWSTSYVHLKGLARWVNIILYLHKEYLMPKNMMPKFENVIALYASSIFTLTRAV